jgi:hypothetical protein
LNPGSSAITFTAGRANHKAKDTTDGEESSREGSKEMKDIEFLSSANIFFILLMKETKKVANKRIANRS